MTQPEIHALLRAALREALPHDPAGAEAYGADSPLSGAGGLLDSYGMMLFLVEVDALLGEKTGSDIVLVNDAALTRKDNPLRSINALAAYIEEFLAP